MKVVILCGGQGTRIRDVTEHLPKPMIQIDRFPILWHIMKYYSTWGHNEFILCLGYKGQIIKDYFLNYAAHTCDFTIDLKKQTSIEYHSNHSETNWRITLVDTGLNSMTGARVKRIQHHLEGDENFMLTYGDGVGNIDLNALVDFHQNHKKIFTITGVRPPGRFGEIAADASGLITEFNEKPQATGGRISGGYFICNKKIFDYLDDREDLVFEQEPMKQLVKHNQMMVYEHNDFWQPMDTYRDYAYLANLCETDTAPWKIW